MGEGEGETLLGEGAVGVPHAWRGVSEALRGHSTGEIGKGGIQKKRPFHNLRSSRSVNAREEVRYVRRESRALSRVGRSGGALY